MAVLQKQGEQWRPVAYASRSMTETKQRYAQVEKEVLGLTWGCERFRDFLIGRHFFLEAEHKPPVSLLGHQTLTELPPRIQRFRLRTMRLLYLKHTWQRSTYSRHSLTCTYHHYLKFKVDRQRSNGRDKHLC